MIALTILNIFVAYITSLHVTDKKLFKPLSTHIPIIQIRARKNAVVNTKGYAVIDLSPKVKIYYAEIEKFTPFNNIYCK
jgi:hypothetical protein